MKIIQTLAGLAAQSSEYGVIYPTWIRRKSAGLWAVFKRPEVGCRRRLVWLVL
jgi:hypothetical protein